MSGSSKLMLQLQGAVWLISIRGWFLMTWATAGKFRRFWAQVNRVVLRLSFHNSEIEIDARGDLGLDRN